MIRSINRLEGSTLSARDGEIGSIRQAYFDDQSWTIRYFVVQAGAWLTGRKVLVPPQAVLQPVGSSSTVDVSLTREQVQRSPDIDTHQPVSRRSERQLHEHYGQPLYWSGPNTMALGTTPLVPGGASSQRQAEHDAALEDVARQEPALEDVHLRSTADVTGHDIQAIDGSIGHVEDFLFDDETWAVHSLVVDTRNWWPGGKKVLLGVESIDRIDWDESKVYVDMSRDAVKRSPDYDPAGPRGYDARLYDASRNQGHWS